LYNTNEHPKAELYPAKIKKMNTQKFKTNIKCSGCLATATPFLNAVVGEDNWEVDLQTSQKTLTVVTESEVSENKIIEAVVQAGYTAEKVA
jgi:copper chaperone CopZ